MIECLVALFVGMVYLAGFLGSFFLRGYFGQSRDDVFCDLAKWLYACPYQVAFFWPFAVPVSLLIGLASELEWNRPFDALEELGERLRERPPQRELKPCLPKAIASEE